MNGFLAVFVSGPRGDSECSYLRKLSASLGKKAAQTLKTSISTRTAVCIGFLFLQRFFNGFSSVEISFMTNKHLESGLAFGFVLTGKKLVDFWAMED